MSDTTHRILKPGSQMYIVLGVLFSFPIALIGWMAVRTGQAVDCARIAAFVLIGYGLICLFLSRSRVVVTADYIAVRSAFGGEQRMQFHDVVASFAIPSRRRAAYIELYSERPNDDVEPALVLSLKTLRHADIGWLQELPQLKLQL